MTISELKLIESAATSRSTNPATATGKLPYYTIKRTSVLFACQEGTLCESIGIQDTLL